MGLDEAIPETEEEPETSGSEEQKKSLVANTYSTGEDDNYKNLDNWGMSESEIQLAYALCAPRGGSAAVQRALNGLFPGGYEEFYSRFQIALGHVFGRSQNIPEFEQEGIEPQGSVPVMNLLNIEGDDIVEYVTSEDVDLSANDLATVLDHNPEVAEELYEVMEEADFGDEAEAPEADD